MKRRNRPIAAIGVAVAAIIVNELFTPAARAEGPVPLGGGAGITVNDTACTLTTIGHDNTGALTGFTASSCGGPGSPVSAGGRPVGNVVNTNDFLHYTVIKFDPAKVTPVANFAGFAINGAGPDPAPNDPACKQGSASGRDCGLVRPFSDSTPDRPVARIQASYQQSDEGGPVTAGDRLIGMIYSGFYTFGGVPLPNIVQAPSRPEIRIIYTSAIFADATAKGGPGAGFIPVTN
jgi:hypothetical protein